MTNELEFAINLAQEAGQLLLQHFDYHDDLATTIKPDRSIVTEADLAADRLITRSILAAFPEDGIVSEELNHSIDQKVLPEALWVVDPLDGTTNFSLGLPTWGVVLARVLNGLPELAVVYFPRLGELYTAQKGCGAKLNGAPIRVRAPEPGKTTTFFSCCSRTHRRYEVNVRYKMRILGSAAYSFCALARGMAVLSFEAAAKVWDVAGAWLLVPEAGGRIEPLSGPAPFPLVSGKEYASWSFPTLAGATPEVLQQGRQEIRSKSAE